MHKAIVIVALLVATIHEDRGRCTGYFVNIRDGVAAIHTF